MWSHFFEELTQIDITNLVKLPTIPNNLSLSALNILMLDGLKLLPLKYHQHEQKQVWRDLNEKSNFSVG